MALAKHAWALGSGSPVVALNPVPNTVIIVPLGPLVGDISETVPNKLIVDTHGAVPVISTSKLCK